MILACHHIHKAFGIHTILKDASFHIEDREKAAIVGINGAGKSTLLKIILGLEPADSGDVILSKGKSIGYLAQHQALSGDTTIFEELLSVKKELIEIERSLRSIENEMKHAQGDQLETLMHRYDLLNHRFEQENGYAYKSEITGVLKGLGFSEDEFDKSTDALSGGQKTRVSLAKLLLTKPDILLMDEPTNHLDLASIAWLETYLTNYNGAVLLVSHDRYFLDRLVTKVIEIENGECTMYQGNYTDYAAKSKQRRDAKLKAYLKQQEEIAHQEEVIRKLKSFNREKSIKRAESREKMLDKMERIDKPLELHAEMHLTLDPLFESGKDVLTVSNITKHFDNQHLFHNLSFDIKRGERIALIGGNGTGKTTILKMINGLLAPDNPDASSIELGANVTIAYYDQEYHVLHPEKTIFEEISDTYPHLTNTEIRNLLAAFLFTGDDVFAPIRTLSGGECGRVSLAKLMLSQANFLILDEPTNHLDIVSKEILEQALLHYTGTILYVSHDRYFINQTATRILELTGETLVPYNGNYDYYLEKRDELTPLYTSRAAAQESDYAPFSSAPSSAADVNIDAASPSSAATETKLSWQEQKELQATKRKRENQLAKVEQRIEEIESRIEEIDQLLSDPANGTNTLLLLDLTKERTSLDEELMLQMEAWESLA